MTRRGKPTTPPPDLTTYPSNMQPVFYTDLHVDGFRSGEQGLIVGVVSFNGKLSFVVLYEDGVVDYKAIYDESLKNYRIDGGS